MNVEQEHFEKLMRMYLSAPTNTYYAPQILIRRGEAEVTVPVRPDFFHSGHAIHGSIYFKVLDDSAYFACSSMVRDRHLVTSQYTLYFIRPVTSGIIRGVGKVITATRRLMIAESEAFDERGKLVARGSGTFMPSDMPLDEKVGYG